jgi:diacylglycerol kinase (CTP)
MKDIGVMESSNIEITDPSGKLKAIIQDGDNASLLSVPSSFDSPLSLSRSSSDSTLFDEDLQVNLSKLRSQASTPLASLSIPSHKRFSKLIHEHEVPRKVMHVSIGFLTLWLYTQGIQLVQVTPVLTALLVVVGSADILRFQSAAFNTLYVRYMGFLMREKEVSQNYNGVIWYLVGLIFVFLLFPKDISLLAVLLLSWADTSASTIGRKYGKYTVKIGNKSLAGSLAAFGTGVFSSWLLYKQFVPLYNYNNLPGDIMWSPQSSAVSFPVLAVVIGFAGAASEAVEFVDDNLTIPILSAVFIWSFVKLTQV